MKSCSKCQGCGCPACLGTGSGYAKGLVKQWGERNGHEGTTPEEVRDLTVIEQRSAQNFLQIHLRLIHDFQAKRTLRAHEKDFEVKPEPRLVPADQPTNLCVRLDQGTVQVRVAYQHALEEVQHMVEFRHQDMRVLIGANSERLFMIEFKLRKGKKMPIEAVTSYLSGLMGWSPGTKLNHDTVLEGLKEVPAWVYSVGV